MKKSLILTAALSTALVACNEQAADTGSAEPSLDTQQQRIGYIVGVSYGSRFKQESLDLDLEAFNLGVRHGLDGTEPLMTREEMNQEMMAYQQQQMDQVANQNKAEGDAYRAEYAEKDDVAVLDSGLMYRVITEGDGPKPGPSDVVEVHYAGTLVDGTEFDSSYKRGQSAQLMLDGVIPGWTEALQLMGVGSKWELVIPPELAYGADGMGRMAPNQTLIFEVELLDIVDTEAAEEEEAASEEG